MYSRPQGSERLELEGELVRLLADVERGDPYYYELWIPKTPSGLKMQVFAPFVRSSWFPR